MASLRRALFAVIANFVLLAGFGSATAAIFHPAPPHSAMGEDDQGEGCGKSGVAACVLVSCTVFCQAVPAELATRVPGDGEVSASYWPEPQMLRHMMSGPEPPPPRMG